MPESASHANHDPLQSMQLQGPLTAKTFVDPSSARGACRTNDQPGSCIELPASDAMRQYRHEVYPLVFLVDQLQLIDHVLQMLLHEANSSPI